MLENDESFIYIKNDEEVNLKTDRFNTEPQNNSFHNNNQFQICDLSDSRILTFENELNHNKDKSEKTVDLETNNFLIDNLNANNNNNQVVYSRNSTSANALALTNKNNIFISNNNNNNNNNYFMNENLNSEKNILKVSKTKKSFIEEEEGPKIISLDEVPMFRKLFIQVHPFILNGYRIHHEFKDCFLSVFKLHNETLNIWTHMLPFIGFLVLLTFLFISNLIK